MLTRIRFPPLVDVVLIDDPAQMRWLDDHPAISRKISGSGGWIHSILQARIYKTLTVDSTPLPAFESREDAARASRQQRLEQRLTSATSGTPFDAADLRELASYVAGVNSEVPIGVTVQRVVGRMFRRDYAATAESYRAARVIAAWPRVNPIKALWWKWSGRLARSRKLLWALGQNDPECIHATAIAVHNIVDTLARMRALASDSRKWGGVPPAGAVTACLVAPSMLLRSCVEEVHVPSLARPLRRGTLLVFRLRKMHEAARDGGLAFSRGEWSQCPAHAIVPRLLEEVWMRAIEALASARYAPRTRSLVERALVAAFARANRRVAWHRLPRWIGVMNLLALRIVLRERNLHDTETPQSRAQAPTPPWEPRFLHSRTADGTFNDLLDPLMGSAGTRFGRNVPLEHTHPGPELREPSPREVSRRLMTRDTFIKATSLNLLAAAWVQFQVHDWFSHGANDPHEAFEIPLKPDDDWPGERPMRISRTRRDPTRSGVPSCRAPTFVNTITHWWDASQLYGSDPATQRRVRTHRDGKLKLDSELLPVDPETGIDITGFSDNWWVGLSLLHTLFTLEHNAICDRLRREHGGWDDERLFATARLVNAALIAKIHTLEWTPAILAHPAVTTGLRGNWRGLVAELGGERFPKIVGRLGDSEVLWGIRGSPTDHHAAPYAITEEFVSVYRMHPLMPDYFDFFSVTSGEKLGETRTLFEVSGRRTRQVLEEIRMPSLLYSFGGAHPGAITLHNYPRGLQLLERDDGTRVDLAAVDVLRDRERGVPRYNAFRRHLGLPAVRSFDELSLRWAQELAEVYGNDVERVDLMVGLFAENPPRGFGFSDTAFRIFIHMASRRLKSDRFFTTDYTPAVYTRAGLDWIEENDMRTVLLRHYPELTPAIQDVDNVFAPWRPGTSGPGARPPSRSLPRP